jgi:hypothetical protein
VQIGVKIRPVLKALGIGRDPTAKRRRIVTSAKVDQPRFWIHSFAGKSPGGEMSVGERLPEGCKSVGLNLLSLGIDKGHDIATMIMQGDIGFAIELKKYRSSYFSPKSL